MSAKRTCNVMEFEELTRVLTDSVIVLIAIRFTNVGVSIELQKQEWKFGKMRNFVGAQAVRRIFSQLLRVLLKLYNSMET